MEGKSIKLSSSEGKEFKVSVEVACKSVLLKNIIEDTDTDEPIYLPNVKEHVLRKIIEYCEHYKGQEPPEIPKPLPQNKLEGLVDPWACGFIDLEVNACLELVLGANYMDIKSLLELSCAKIATFIKGKTVEQIREQFGIENDFTPEEEAEIREENKWAEEIA